MVYLVDAFSPQHRDSLTRSGVSDYAILPLTLQGHPFALIELKRSRKRDSSISKEQVDFLLSRERQGGFCCIAYGKNAAIAIVELLYKWTQTISSGVVGYLTDNPEP